MDLNTDSWAWSATDSKRKQLTQIQIYLFFYLNIATQWMNPGRIPYVRGKYD